ncbi:hypothetical protein SULI_07705 [Saccharolobus solfataricus]|uniref:Fuselloviral protein SSV7_gp27 n=2 Tax=Saccharolobus solfataricus TaxID=2287 RepID=A0A0E3GV10_SACSO|nr:hypothetical protein [Saccharolobus solfataricus]AKA73809.1 hypothetical protein SULB_1545 [Saccharolobus solfataricus]AKA76506.1 hypothetical protein SULC_1543 [Saccharolobus solfataricus]AKA79199.1 hypothetical protein SULA_1544 [Saccharolobus solfataricus]AZF68285.1 hypothetical protein SULG_07705 [Saccharolobus solfataricus]AZF70905.1 hypothetical protein SULH_07705 [Saccharolobus solfataricus]
MALVLNNSPPIVLNTSFSNPGGPCICSSPPPPWYVQILPELIIFAGFASLILTIYFSPGLRSALRSVVRWLRGSI